MTGSFLLLATTIGSALLIGFIPALMSRLRPVLASGLELSDQAVDRLKTAYLLSLIPLMISAGWAVDRWPKEVLFAGNLLAALGIAALGLRPSYHATFWVVVVLGVASSCLTCAGITLMPKAFWGDPQNPERAASLNLGFIAVGVGGLLVPALCNFCVKRFSFRQCLLVLAFLCLLPATFTVFSAGAEFPDTAAQTGTILGEPVLWLAGLVMFLYYPLQGSLDSWVKNYLGNLGYDEKKTTYWHVAFWGAFLATRLTAGLYLDPRYEAWVLFVLVLASAIILGNLAGAYGQRSVRELLLVGVCLGSILPTFLGVVLTQFPQAQGTVLGIMFSLGTLSTLLLQPLLARLARGSVQVTIRVPLALALAVAVPCLILALVRQ
jgi:fucose permease